MLFYSSTLEVPCIQNKLKVKALVAFFGHKDEQRMIVMPKNKGGKFLEKL